MDWEQAVKAGIPAVVARLTRLDRMVYLTMLSVPRFFLNLYSIDRCYPIGQKLANVELIDVEAGKFLIRLADEGGEVSSVWRLERMPDEGTFEKPSRGLPRPVPAATSGRS